MNNIADLHSLLTSDIDINRSKSLVLDFSKQLGWNPSYFIEPSKVEKSNGYLVIEHGLQNAAIISFLKERNEDLTQLEEENLLGISYNNLVNWHITIDSRYVNYYFILNRENRKVATRKIEKGNEEEALNVTTFYEIIGKKPNANIKSLDDVLIDNISTWKKTLSAELNNAIDLVSLSHLFNATIFLRSIEDSKKRANELDYNSRIYLEIINDETCKNISDVFTEVENKLGVKLPQYITDRKKIELFNPINISDVRRFFKSFYENEYNRFKYDFSIMTKQALSRIYQKYVSILSVPEISIKSQQDLFNFAPIPTEKINKDNGAYYTPEYIARFFAKYICRKYTQKEFDSLKFLEPAVGSGIFLRTLLETQIEQRISKGSELNISTLFDNTLGIDVDPNAVLSTSLSLTLLHYVFNKQFSKPNVITGDSIAIMQSKINLGEKFDVIISNPPYINQDNKDLERLNQYKEVLSGLNNGKVDIYQAFIKLSIDLLNPNGLGLFVLPHNFLTGDSSKKLRNYLLDNCNVEFLADLSSINVFNKVGTYNILIGFRKRSLVKNNISSSWLLKCRSSVGEALNQLLIENESELKEFQVYKATDYFKADGDWFLLTRKEYNLLNKLKENKPIESYLKVNQGLITGNDEIFIREKGDVDKNDKLLYKSYLPDKEIEKFSIEKKGSKVIFYPFINNRIISEQVLSSTHKSTWNYLEKWRNNISPNKEVSSNKRIWWTLHRSRKPEYINAAKIVVPYMSITPKFCLDIEGEYATSRSPYFILKEDTDSDLLFYFLGILNSAPCYWALSLQAQKQSSGYNIFHLNVLKNTPIPDPTFITNSSLVSLMISRVKSRVVEKNEIKKIELESQINKIACELYNLTPQEMELLGI